jgi:diketogulonate reductase-like aldo/keto reductase
VLGAILLLAESVGSSSSKKNLRSGKFGRMQRVMVESPSSTASLRGAVGSAIPFALYGTAWKKEKTAALVEKAIRAGFRGVDTACQPKHYNEKAVGEGISKAVAAGVVTRSDLFLQTKFTSLSGQDPSTVPYSKTAPLAEQVRQSLQVSLANLQTDYLDSWVLHSPMKTMEQTLTVWGEFESAVRSRQVVHIGLSNCYDVTVLSALYAKAEIKPRFLQNRFYRETSYDADIREFCKANGITYQSFWTLTANPEVLKSPAVREIAAKHGKTREQVWFAFVVRSGAMFLTGTTSDEHMAEDLEVPALAKALSAEDVSRIEALLL